MKARYLVAESEVFEGRTFRFAYDCKYKSFVRVEVLEGKNWVQEKNAGQNFYVYFPGFARNLRNADQLPRWAR